TRVRAYHWVEVKMKMLSMNVGKPVAIPKLNEAMAIELGAELVGEGVIFVITAAVLIAEYVRSTRKANAEEEERKAEMTKIHTDLVDLREVNSKLEAELQELFRILHVNIPAIPNQSNNVGSKSVLPATAAPAPPSKGASGTPGVK
ncbi:unnamed protein product, partial [Allacma fusca]